MELIDFYNKFKIQIFSYKIIYNFTPIAQFSSLHSKNRESSKTIFIRCEKSNNVGGVKIQVHISDKQKYEWGAQDDGIRAGILYLAVNQLDKLVYFEDVQLKNQSNDQKKRYNAILDHLKKINEVFFEKWGIKIFFIWPTRKQCKGRFYYQINHLYANKINLQACKL